MKLEKLVLNNFQGIRTLEVDFNGLNTTIYGDNATGKTTIFNAVTWLLFDKASTGAKNFTPKTRTADGEAHNLEHSTEAVFIVSEDEKIALKKVFREVYKKKNGTAESVFSGHTVDYFVNAIPVKEREYQEAIADLIGDIETAHLLTAPDYFPRTLNWEKRREILLNVCGDVSDTDVIASNPDLSELLEALRINGTDKLYTVEDFLKTISPKKSEINKALSTIPARIDEANKAIPTIEDVNAVGIKERIESIDALIRDLEARKSNISFEASSELSKKLGELEVSLSRNKAEFLEKENEKNSEISKELLQAQIKSRDLMRKFTGLDGERISAVAEKERLEKLRNSLIDEYKKVASVRFEDENSDTCPICGSAIPEEKLLKLREEFNVKKSLELSAINQRGKQEASKEQIDALGVKIKDLEKNISDVEAMYAKARDKVTALASAQLPAVKFEDTEEYKAVITEIANIKSQMNDASAFAKERASAIDKEISELYSSRSAEQDKLIKLEVLKTQSDRIKQLEDEEKRLGREYSKLERLVYLCDLFTRTKVSMLDDKINARFNNVKFSLFSEQINGGLKPECVVLIPNSSGDLVPFEFANTAAQINAGLDIINVLGEHYGRRMPVFIDNAESVTRLTDISAQVVKLTVSERDKVLRYEHE